MGLVSNISNRFRDAVWNWLSEGRATMLLTTEEKKAQSLIVLARRYYDGDHDIKLTERQKAWLDQHTGTVKFTVNQCPIVVDTPVERMQVIGFEVVGEKKVKSKDGTETADENSLSHQAWNWWEENRMDAIQTEAYRKAGIDGESFILSGWEEDEVRPDWVLHPRYVDESLGGDGYGMWIEYPNNDYLQKAKRAVKQWKELSDDGRTITYRRTVYYPDRIERFVRGKDGKWEPFKETEGEVWPKPWTLPDGKPIGIPVAHFRVPNLKSDLADIIPLQDGLDKTWVDIFAAGDTTAFRMLILLGLVPTTDGKEPKDDGSNLLKLLPGQMWSSKKSPQEAAIHVIDPAEMAPLLDTEDRIVMRIASISSTPLSRFVTSRQIASEESQKQQEGPLLGKVRERHTVFGNAWEDLIKVSARMAIAFGSASFDERPKIRTLWQSPEVRNATEQIQELEGKSRLGVDDETIWHELGYDEVKIKRFKKAKFAKQKVADSIAARASPAGQQGKKPGQRSTGPPGSEGQQDDEAKAA